MAGVPIPDLNLTFQTPSEANQKANTNTSFQTGNFTAGRANVQQPDNKIFIAVVAGVGILAASMLLKGK